MFLIILNRKYLLQIKKYVSKNICFQIFYKSASASKNWTKVCPCTFQLLQQWFYTTTKTILTVCVFVLLYKLSFSSNWVARWSERVFSKLVSSVFSGTCSNYSHGWLCPSLVINILVLGFDSHLNFERAPENTTFVTCN